MTGNQRFFISLFKPISDLLVLVPSTLFYLHLWRLITNLFVERNLIVLLWSSYCFYQFILYIQPNWSVKESLKFIVIVQLTSTFLLVIFSLLLFISTSVVYTFYKIEIFGSCALAMAALIALKQFLPDTVLFTTPYGRLKNGHLPICSFFVFLICWIIGLVRGTVIFQIMYWAAEVGRNWDFQRFFPSSEKILISEFLFLSQFRFPALPVSDTSNCSDPRLLGSFGYFVASALTFSNRFRTYSVPELAYGVIPSNTYVVIDHWNQSNPLRNPLHRWALTLSPPTESNCSESGCSFFSLVSFFPLEIFKKIVFCHKIIYSTLRLSLQISWTYLRFFQERGGMGEQVVGDRSEHFCWASFFPRIIQPFATLIGRFTFRSLHRFGLLKRVIGKEHLDYMQENSLQMEALECIQVKSVGTAVLAPEGWDSERKRQKALRMLNERLMASNTINASPENNQKQLHESPSSPQLTKGFGGFEEEERPYKFAQFQQTLPPKDIEENNEELTAINIIDELNENEERR
ncbi:unnamed protein product [Meloidogyne enterolobii]|uniref:Uncharacterized protein n=1 Tax=Meloidogyne enterolobii TaxID=390850 RepID=A0ACB1A1S2_MELEN